MKKIIVPDTNVLLLYEQALYQFEKNDIALPLVVLSELDTFKKGNDARNFLAREVTRSLDKLSTGRNVIDEWVPLGKGLGKLCVKHANGSVDPKKDANKKFGEVTNDHKILNVCILLQTEYPKRKVILVTKDANLRVKARALGIEAQDYEAGKVKTDSLYTGKQTIHNLDTDIIDDLYKKKHISIDQLNKRIKNTNEYLIIKSTDERKSALAFCDKEAKVVNLITKDSISVSKISPRNAEQAFSFHALLNEKIGLVTLRGPAGTGKTLLAIASAIEQRNKFHQIFITRPIISLNNKDIGFLPGDAEDKTRPYMQPIFDQIKFIKSKYGFDSGESKNIGKMIENKKIEILPLAFIRGRTLSQSFVIVDEAQNLTPLEARTIISRAGENTKIVFTGDVNQIDTPYLDIESNGLSFLISKIKNHHLCAHVALEKGERSELANLDSELLI